MLRELNEFVTGLTQFKLSEYILKSRKLRELVKQSGEICMAMWQVYIASQDATLGKISSATRVCH
jgi:hypothetical protein